MTPKLSLLEGGRHQLEASSFGNRDGVGSRDGDSRSLGRRYSNMPRLTYTQRQEPALTRGIVPLGKINSIDDKLPKRIDTIDTIDVIVGALCILGIISIIGAAEPKKTGATYSGDSKYPPIDLPNQKNRKGVTRGAQIEAANLFKNLMNDWNLSLEEMAILLGKDFHDSGQKYVEGLLEGRCSFSGRDTRDRMARLIHIREALFAIFKDHKVENDWLRASQEMLDDQVPMDLLLEGSMENLWLVQEFVEATAGW